MPDGGTLALDLNGVGRQKSAAIGWAYGLLEWENPISGFWPFPQSVLAARYVAFVDLFNDVVVDEWKPKNVYFEKPLPPNIPNTNALTMEQIYGVLAFVREACWRASIPISGEHVDTIRSDVIGRCRWYPRWEGDTDATKAGVRDFVRNTLKLDVTENNQCDAIIVWHHYRQRMLNIPSAKMPLFRSA